LRQFFLAGEGFEGVGSRSGSLLLGSERTDVVFDVDGENHCESPLFRALCGHDINHSEVLETQGNSEINRRGRRVGDAGPHLAGFGS
jgi:hypothetical protein